MKSQTPHPNLHGNTCVLSASLSTKQYINQLTLTTDNHVVSEISGKSATRIYEQECSVKINRPDTDVGQDVGITAVQKLLHVKTW